MKASTFFPLVVGVAAAIVAFSAWKKTAGRTEGSTGSAPVNGVVVAQTDIPYASRISADKLTTVEYRGVTFPIAQSFSQTEGLVGRVTSTKIVAGTPVTLPMLAPEGTPPGAYYQIADGFRAVPVPVESYAARNLEPGSRVDVFTASRRSGGERQSRPTELILQDVEVFAVGRRLPGMNAVDERVDSVELLLPADRVAVLSDALMSGGIRMVMRGATDRQILDIPTVPPAEPEVPVVAVEPEPEPRPVEKPVDTLTVKVYNGPEESRQTYDRPVEERSADVD
ncbi:MAG TPA: Flp pilus assembly protein CpaB [Phycisphaerae bacterium]|nr:Flp pilus assembly protein CpaB [Phycisphaerae bacterium]